MYKENLKSTGGETMNFSSSLMSGMNLSLGGLEIATDFLYGNTDLYEPDLTEVKTTISNKPMREIIRSNKKVAKPKLSRDAIINKYSLIKTEKNKSKSIDDTILGAENTQDLIVDYEDDFDFSFDDENITDVNNEESIESEEDYLDEDSNILYADENSSEEDLALSAASLMQAIASGALTMGHNEQEDEDDEFFIDDDEDDNNNDDISNIEDEINSIDDIDIDDMDDDDIDEVDNEDSENTLESEKNNMNYNTNDDDDLTLLAASSLSYDPDDFDETDDDEDDNQSTDSDASDEDDINIEDEDDFDINIEDEDEFDIDDSDDEDNEDAETDDSEEVNLDNIDEDNEDEDNFDIDDDDNFNIEDDEDEFEIDVDDEDEFEIEDEEDEEDEEDSSDNDIDINIEDEDIADDEEDIADEADEPTESIAKDNEAKVKVQESNVQDTVRESAAQTIKNKQIKQQSNAGSSYDVEKQKLLKELAYYKKIAQETLNNKTSEKSEIEKMQKKLALIEKKMLSMSSADTNKSTSKLKNDSLNSNNKKVAKAVTSQNSKEKQSIKPVDPYSRYNDMAIDSLFNVVKRFMIENGVNSKLIDISLLNNKFGSANIKRLMSKSYIISIGKGVTIGR